MNKILVSGLINIETTLKVDRFPLELVIESIFVW
jgi:hypothetical protein